MANEAVKRRLEEIAAANSEGRLTPEDVVADARSKDSPLHGYFTWNVKEAAYKCWLDEARKLITSVTIQVTTQETAVRAVYYVRDPSAGKHQGYVSVKTLRSDEDRAREALLAEFGRVADLLRRARALATALGSGPDVEEILNQVVGLSLRYSPQDQPSTQ